MPEVTQFTIGKDTKNYKILCTEPNETEARRRLLDSTGGCKEYFFQDVEVLADIQGNIVYQYGIVFNTWSK